MNETDLSRKNIFIVKVRGKENSKTVQIPDSVCEFCGINLGDLIKLEIIVFYIPCRRESGGPKLRFL